MYPRPDFIIAGAGRAGTTSLYSYLEQHPDIGMSRPKEISFFSRYYSRGEDFYAQFFRHCRDDQVIGEGSQNEMVSEEAPRRIRDFNKDMKLIFILRDPVYRMFSDYRRNIQAQGLKETFSSLVKKSEENKDYRERFVEKSLYHKHISRFLQHFPVEQLYFIIFEDLLGDERRELRDLCRFLQVDVDFEFNKNAIEKNPSKLPASRTIQSMIFKIQSMADLHDPIYKRALFKGIAKPLDRINHLFTFHADPTLDLGTRRYLIETYFGKDTEKLEKLIKKELPSWKQ